MFLGAGLGHLYLKQSTPSRQKGRMGEESKCFLVLTETRFCGTVSYWCQISQASA